MIILSVLLQFHSKSINSSTELTQKQLSDAYSKTKTIKSNLNHTEWKDGNKISDDENHCTIPGCRSLLLSSWQTASSPAGLWTAAAMWRYVWELPCAVRPAAAGAQPPAETPEGRDHDGVSTG